MTSMGCGQSRVSAVSENNVTDSENGKIDAISEEIKTAEVVRCSNGDVVTSEGVYLVSGGIAGKYNFNFNEFQIPS